MADDGGGEFPLSGFPFFLALAYSLLPHLIEIQFRCCCNLHPAKIWLSAFPGRSAVAGAEVVKVPCCGGGS